MNSWVSRIFSPLSKRCLLILLLAILAGCSGRQIAFPEPPATQLGAVPFYPQEAYQCGPAALATVLGWSGSEVDLAALVASVYLPGRQGSLQPEIVAAARRAGRIPYPIPADPASIGAELAAGHPVLVLQNLGLASSPRWHYAVVVGYDPVDGNFILRSGTERSRREDVQRFMSSWQRADYWGLVVLPPGQLPASQHVVAPLVRALADAEAFLSVQDALATWERLLAQWPDDPEVLFGSANARRRGADPASAASLFRQLLRHDPGHVAARNNFADLLLSQGCVQRAGQVMAGIDDGAVPDYLAGAITDTRRSLREEARHHRSDADRCADW
ncbi:PA2778 family cysteine peptidase [Chromatocurvus halotolerans]|uniref:Peptidase C39-like protein n=1 Tax=Chromatocurvus halotolerans TaxID=1132028 RepID=A0A4R2KQV7_9GAMM|nr:PA2778 family cysteine peptidase [Chromatocurvus halotolerans]TCO76661.1 peptidase C39-like protein [Chromatocurvus halotolerans]